MSSSRPTGSSGWRRLSPLLLLLTSGACASILGIEEIHVDEGVGGSAGSGGSSDSPAGGSNSKGGSSSASAGKSAGGGNQSGGGSPTAGTGADGPGGSESSGGSGGSGGAAPITGKVHGRVIDVWQQNVANVPVQLGDVSVITNGDGEFEFDDVPATYDVSLAITLTEIERYGYVFNGLTRRDPTLQVARAWSFQSGNYVVSALNVTPDFDAGDEVGVAWAGAGFSIDVTTGKAGRSGTTDWLGPSTTVPGSARALWLTRDGTSGLPTAYHAAAGTSFVLGGAGTATMTFNLTGAPPQSGNIQGTVTPSTGIDRVNKLFLRYSSGEVMELVDQSGDSINNFTFKAPSVLNTSLTVSASEGTSSYSQYAVIHKDGLAPGATTTLKIPTPARIAAPALNAMVDNTTQFSITPGTHTAKTFVAVISATLDSPYFDKLYIIGSDTKFTLPQVAGEDFMRPATDYYWRITTHGSAQTVDDMTDEAGFFDSFGVDETTPSGPRTGDGEYTISEGRVFTTKP